MKKITVNADEIEWNDHKQEFHHGWDGLAETLGCLALIAICAICLFI